MKSFFLSQNFFLMSFLAIQLSICSKDDDTPKEVESFEPVTINLEGLDVGLDDTTFVVDGYNFRAFRAESYAPGNGNNGISLAYPQDGELSMIELDLSQLQGASSVTLDIFNNAGSTVVSLWNNGNLVEENTNIPNAEVDDRFKETVMNLNGREVDAVRVSSFEAIVKTIRLE